MVSLKAQNFVYLKLINNIMGNTAGFEAFPGFAGVTSSIVLANLGAGYGMAKSGAGVAGLG